MFLTCMTILICLFVCLLLVCLLFSFEKNHVKQLYFILLFLFLLKCIMVTTIKVLVNFDNG